MNCVFKCKAILLCFVLFVNTTYSQIDTLRIVKNEESTTLFSSIGGQAVKAKVSKKLLFDEHKLIVNDTIKISSYWFTCFSEGLKHEREETSEELFGDVLRDISKLPIGGKAYFTNIKGYNIYNNNPYDIYDLEVEIVK